MLYEEVKELYGKMENSILMIFQYFPRKNRSVVIKKLSEEIQKRIKPEGSSLCVSDNIIAFFFLPKGRSVAISLTEVLERYRKRYGLNGVKP